VIQLNMESVNRRTYRTVTSGALQKFSLSLNFIHSLLTGMHGSAWRQDGGIILKAMLLKF
jgi:hypothetical protein